MRHFSLIIFLVLFLKVQSQNQMTDSIFINKIQNKNWVWSDSKTGFIIDLVLTPDTMILGAINVVFGTPEPDLCSYEKEYIDEIVCITPLNCNTDNEKILYTYVYLKNDKTVLYCNSETKLLKKEDILQLKEWIELTTQ